MFSELPSSHALKRLKELKGEPDPKLEQSLRDAVWVRPFCYALNAHSHWNYEHSVRVGYISSEINPTDSEYNSILFRAGLLHDIGKIFVRKEILESTRELNEDDYAEVRAHPTKGFDFLKDDDLLVASIIVAHHQFQDNPYPKSNGPEPFRTTPDEYELRRVLALADKVDACMSFRLYKDAMSEEETAESLSRWFDEKLIQSAIEAFKRVNS